MSRDTLICCKDPKQYLTSIRRVKIPYDVELLFRLSVSPLRIGRMTRPLVAQVKGNAVLLTAHGLHPVPPAT